MYTWIWRTLPGGLPGKLAGSTLLLAAAVALLFFWVFPTVEPLLPFSDVTVGSEEQAPVLEPTVPGELGTEPAPS
jgi:hypothetical protein